MGAVFDGIVLALYPVIVFFGLKYLSVRWTALLLLVLLGRRFVAAIFTSKETSVPAIIQIAAMGGLIGGAGISRSEIFLRFTPFLISLVFFAQFAFSLRSTPIIERFARLKRPDLPPDHVRYCLALTKIWLLVFAGNSALVLAAAFVESKGLWAVLVGPVSYAYLGIFLTSEYIFRKRRFGDFNPKSPIDRMIRAIFKNRKPE